MSSAGSSTATAIPDELQEVIEDLCDIRVGGDGHRYTTGTDWSEFEPEDIAAMVQHISDCMCQGTHGVVHNVDIICSICRGIGHIAKM